MARRHGRLGRHKSRSAPIAVRTNQNLGGARNGGSGVRPQPHRPPRNGANVAGGGTRHRALLLAGENFANDLFKGEPCAPRLAARNHARCSGGRVGAHSRKRRKAPCGKSAAPRGGLGAGRKNSHDPGAAVPAREENAAAWRRLRTRVTSSCAVQP